MRTNFESKTAKVVSLDETGLSELTNEQLIHIYGGGSEDLIIDPISDYKRKLV